ncbi:MAG: nucleotidyltransferase family protein, partial [Thermoanaerobaculia bacterium]
MAVESETISAPEPAPNPAADAATATVPAIVLAGDKRGSHPVFGANKNLLEVGGEPLVRHVVRTLLEVEQIEAIYVVGPDPALRRALEGLAYPSYRPVHAVPQRETIVQNCWQGLRRALGADSKADLDRLKVEHADAVALILPGDLPFLDPAEVRHFLRHADMEQYDYVLGLTAIETLNRVVNEAEVPELRKPALHMAEGRVRQNNLHLIRPFSIVHLEYFESFYEHRYQKELWNTVKVLWGVLRASGGISRPVGYYLFAQAAMRAELMGFERLAAWFRRRVPTAGMCAAISRFSGCRFGVLTGPGAGAARDVDSERDHELTRTHHHQH